MNANNISVQVHEYLMSALLRIRSFFIPQYEWIPDEVSSYFSIDAVADLIRAVVESGALPDELLPAYFGPCSHREDRARMMEEVEATAESLRLLIVTSLGEPAPEDKWNDLKTMLEKKLKLFAPQAYPPRAPRLRHQRVYGSRGGGFVASVL